MWSVFVLLVLTLESGSVLTQTEVCKDTNTPSAMFSVVSRQNQTGHWLSEVSLCGFAKNQLAEEPQDSGALQFDLSFSRTRCGSGERLLTKVFVTVPPISKPGAPHDYEFHEGLGYYKLHREKKNWYQALAACQDECAHLVIINSEEEAKLIKTMASGSYVHIGFYEAPEEGQYVTVFDEPLNMTGFNRWAPNEPNHLGKGTEECGSVHTMSGGLNDISCTVEREFICEMKI